MKFHIGVSVYERERTLLTAVPVFLVSKMSGFGFGSEELTPSQLPSRLRGFIISYLYYGKHIGLWTRA